MTSFEARFKLPHIYRPLDLQVGLRNDYIYGVLLVCPGSHGSKGVGGILNIAICRKIQNWFAWLARHSVVLVHSSKIYEGDLDKRDGRLYGIGCEWPNMDL